MYHKAKHIDMRIYRVRELASGNNPAVKLFDVNEQIKLLTSTRDYGEA